jgi:transcriptional regulator with XRE-family HTH domain
VVLPISEVRRIVDRVCARQDVLDACAERDLGYVIAFFEKSGLTQGQMAGLTGLHQNRLSDYKTGKHRPKEYSVFAAFADGLSLPPAARQALGLDASPAPATTTGVPQPRPASFAEISLDYPRTAGQAAGNVTSLWRTDLADQNVLVRTGIDPGTWKDASLRWLVDPVSPPEADLAGGMRVGPGDVERFAVTVEAFRQLDDRFGGGNARQALIQYLGTDADRLLRGRYTGAVGSALFSTVAEATLLAAWMSYDSAPAQRAGAAVLHPGARPSASRRGPAARGEHPGRDEPSGHLHRPVRGGGEPGPARPDGHGRDRHGHADRSLPHHGGAGAGPAG